MNELRYGLRYVIVKRFITFGIILVPVIYEFVICDVLRPRADIIVFYSVQFIS